VVARPTPHADLAEFSDTRRSLVQPRRRSARNAMPAAVGDDFVDDDEDG
jgi:hypothetical protein